MRTVHVQTAEPYDVYIGADLLSECGQIINKAAGGSKAMIVSDSNVAPLYLEKVVKSMEAAGYECVSKVINAGEEHKNFATLVDIVETAATERLSRKDIMVALGGGVVGDITGFAAAVYMRGIGYVQLPTTVLAAVDSSVGGKTAVDLPMGKNLAGAFYQPKAVICDYNCFDTLPDRDRNSGYAEVIKYAMIRGTEIFDMLDGPVENLIAKCITIKAVIVSEDEHESGVRQLLNFGHTIGHALEQNSGYTMLHGEAVARGMVYACELAEAKGKLAEGTKKTLIDALLRYNLDVDGAFDAEAIEGYMRNDKKAGGDKVNFVMPERIGACTVERMDIGEIVGVINELHNC